MLIKKVSWFVKIEWKYFLHIGIKWDKKFELMTTILLEENSRFNWVYGILEKGKNEFEIQFVKIHKDGSVLESRIGTQFQNYNHLVRLFQSQILQSIMK